MGTPLYNVSVDCLYCESSFESLKVKTSKVVKQNQDSDFCTYYKGENPFFYEVFVCPNCGFSFTKNFSTKLKDEQKQAFKPLASKWYKRHKYSMARCIGPAIEAYKLAFISAQTIEEHDLVLAGLSLRLAWFFRYKNDGAQEYKFLRTAKKYYKQAYENGKLSGYEQPEVYIIYLIGELSARTGKNHDAIRWFSKVTEHKERSLHQSIEKKARERWNEVKEKVKKEEQSDGQSVS
ncbi:DUF2225 domain-containing protein [Proteinivorax hydrogeniformans]|uniref:DUF2225 domain-containing protein n=1 Tax=Proteinivorax hydrogeniformans TaxID=1826727 RepID=A0AAU8HRW1_9FIRM